MSFSGQAKYVESVRNWTAVIFDDKTRGYAVRLPSVESPVQFLQPALNEVKDIPLAESDDPSIHDLVEIKLTEANYRVVEIDSNHQLFSLDLQFTIPETLWVDIKGSECYIFFEITVKRSRVNNAFRLAWFNFKSMQLQFPSLLRPNPVFLPGNAIEPGSLVPVVAGFFSGILTKLDPRVAFTVSFETPNAGRSLAYDFSVSFNFTLTSIYSSIKRFIPYRHPIDSSSELGSDDELSGSFDLLFST